MFHSRFYVIIIILVSGGFPGQAAHPAGTILFFFSLNLIQEKIKIGEFYEFSSVAGSYGTFHAGYSNISTFYLLQLVTDPFFALNSSNIK